MQELLATAKPVPMPIPMPMPGVQLSSGGVGRVLLPLETMGVEEAAHDVTMPLALELSGYRSG